MALNVTFFNSLSLYDQLDIVRRHGEYMTKVAELENIINLYVLDNVFVEVYFHKNSTGVQFIKLIDMHDRRMDLYLGKVNLADLYRRNVE